MIWILYWHEIHDKALACGYDSCGIVPLDALDFYKDRLTKRLEDVPESEDVYAHSKAFLALKENYHWAQSIVVCTEYFGNYKFPVSLQNRYAKGITIIFVISLMVLNLNGDNLLKHGYRVKIFNILVVKPQNQLVLSLCVPLRSQRPWNL